MRDDHIKAALLLLLAALAACKAEPSAGPAAADIAAVPPPRATGRATLSIVGTNDLHGGVLGKDGKGGLALLGGYLANLRAARAADGGAVLLVDGGDMFQGTLESNLCEGSAVVRAYNRLGYDAVTIGNHEFDFGPVGEPATPRTAADDPFGALKARAVEATFPFLTANLIDTTSRKPPEWPNVRPTVMIEKSGIRIGVIGVTTEGTLRTTMGANVRTLALLPVAEVIARHAEALRAAGAQVVVVAAHAGGKCKEFGAPEDLTSCSAEEEIFEVARALPPGAVDVIVAGHTHQGVAHIVNGVAIIESFAGGRAFGRVDVVVDRGAARVVDRKVFRPTDLEPGQYEGAPVVADTEIERMMAPELEAARRKKVEPLGVVLDGVITRDRQHESAEGNLVADLMRAARPAAQVAITNGGGLRADLPAGPLSYGALYEALPFDNRFALVTMTGRDLAHLFADNLQRSEGILSISGARVTARCRGGELEVTTTIPEHQEITVVTSDFLATGGDLLKMPTATARVEDGLAIRDELAALLRKRRGRIAPGDVYDPARPRLVYQGQRPLRCPAR